MPSNFVLQTLRHVWLTLAPLNIPAAVVGGIALAAWKYVRATKDIDLLLGIGKESFDRLLPHFVAAGIRPKGNSHTTRLGHLDLVQLLYEPPESLMDMQVDLLLADSPYHRTAIERRVSMTLPDLDVQIAVLACEDLILHKLLAGRMIDLADAVELLRGNRNAMDLDYLKRWAGSLAVDRELADVWKEAFSERSA